MKNASSPDDFEARLRQDAAVPERVVEREGGAGGGAELEGAAVGHRHRRRHAERRRAGPQHAVGHAERDERSPEGDGIHAGIIAYRGRDPRRRLRWWRGTRSG